MSRFWGSGGDALLLSRMFSSVSTSGGISISTAPTLAGDAVVGQTLRATNGTYSVTPDFITPTWTVGGSVISDATGDALLIQDIYAGLGIVYSEVASKAGYTNSASNAATATGSVATISLSNAITAFSRTSSSGTTPMTWSLSFGANVYAGYMLRMEEFNSGSFLDAAHRVQDFHYQLTNDDIQPSANLKSALLAAGFADTGATNWLRPTVYTTSPNGLGYEFMSSTVLSPTDQVIPMTFSATNNYQAIVVGGTGNMTAQGNSGSGVRNITTNRALAATGKYYIEFACPNGNAAICLYDASADLTKNVFDELFGGTNNAHAAGYLSSGWTDYNGTSTSGLTTESAGDGVDMAVDQDNHKVWWRVASGDGASAASWLPSGNPATNTGGVNISAMTGSISPGVEFFANGAQCTIRPSTFTRTPPSGFVAP